jgi:UDP-N-acetylmuramyl tripeptide synthase
VIWERGGFTWDERWPVANLGVENLRRRVSELAGLVYGNPSDTLWMAGVTGTNGKTSVSQWIASASNSLGRRSAVIGTLGNGLVGERVEGRNTTPDPIVLQRLLAEYLRRGARNVAMEVSSHGLHQGRVAASRYDVAGSPTSRATTSTTTARWSRTRRRSSRSSPRAASRTPSSTPTTSTARAFARRLEGAPGGDHLRNAGRCAPARARRAPLGGWACVFNVASDWGRGEVAARVLGAFNVSNLLGVLGALLAQGIPFDAAVAAVGGLEPVPRPLGARGRRHVAIGGDRLRAHADALEKALAALRPTVAAGHRLVCVFGCGGDRDPGKRPIMGEVAARLADHVLVTSDNPRGENPHDIITQILEGIPRRRAEAIEDRQVAIFSAVAHATAGDVVLLAGKGHETYQEIAGTRHPFNDREVAGAALAQWKPGAG